jgi:peptidoglycan-synthase activator LpoB
MGIGDRSMRKIRFLILLIFTAEFLLITTGCAITPIWTYARPNMLIPNVRFNPDVSNIVVQIDKIEAAKQFTAETQKNKLLGVDIQTFRNSLHDSLELYGFNVGVGANQNQANYIVNARILDQDVPGMGLSIHVKVTIEYLIKDALSNKTLLKKTVQTNGNADVSEHMEGRKRVFYALERAFAKNIQELISLFEDRLPVRQPEISNNEISEELVITMGSDSEEKSVLTVMDLKTTGITTSDALLIADLIGSSVFSTNRFRVIDRNARKEILDEVSFSLSGSADEFYQIEAGRLLSADKIIIGSIGNISSRYILNLKLLEVETGETLNLISRVYVSVNNLIDDCEQMGKELTK